MNVSQYLTLCGRTSARRTEKLIEIKSADNDLDGCVNQTEQMPAKVGYSVNLKNNNICVSEKRNMV